MQKRSIKFCWHVLVCAWLGAGVGPGRSASPASGVKVFNKHCAPCHGKDGRAKTPVARVLGVKDFSQSTIGDEEIARQIREGKKGADGLQKMPPFADKVSEEEIKELIEVIRKFRKPR
ncbi:MAG: cytochrome c [Verrucomicrobia bacterium]|jgi:mono/diheme cytochrome c family protein|nr:cytochrome c [Verrucomicrobiota bacterium]